MQKRLDVMVYERGLAKSREKAKVLIMEGYVYVDNQKCDKAGMMYDNDCIIDVRGDRQNKYVSRGGFKLEKAINSFNIDLKDKVAIDVGASTGGFTDCMLQNGATLVYAIDVGYGQLDWKLRNDKRVINLERTNFRYINRLIIKDKIDFFSVDVSFISLSMILPVLSELISDNSYGVCLIKPQFEVGRGKVGKGGVVKDKEMHIQVINNVFEYGFRSDFDVLGLDYSPIKGPKGNIEYLLFLNKNKNSEKSIESVRIGEVVEKAHANLNGGD